MTPWTVVHQAPLFMGFSRQEYWSGLPFPPPGIFPTQGSNLWLRHCRQGTPREAQQRELRNSLRYLIQEKAVTSSFCRIPVGALVKLHLHVHLHEAWFIAVQGVKAESRPGAASPHGLKGCGQGNTRGPVLRTPHSG